MYQQSAQQVQSFRMISSVVQYWLSPPELLSHTWEERTTDQLLQYSPDCLTLSSLHHLQPAPTTLAAAGGRPHHPPREHSQGCQGWGECLLQPALLVRGGEHSCFLSCDQQLLFQVLRPCRHGPDAGGLD